MISSGALRQRADYTHKYNLQSGRHGWLRLTPAYSVKVVEEILDNNPGHKRIFDPFCGSGTTSLCAALRGLPSATTDINPFLVWLAKIKTRNYSRFEIKETREVAELILRGVGRDFEPASPPPIHRIERWWTKRNLAFLCSLKGAIDHLEVSQISRELLRVAFCRILIKLSNAAFNHQSMSFGNNTAELDLAVDYTAIVRHELAAVLDGCTEQLGADADIVLQDARSLRADTLGKFDLVITSPPYANRMSYIRELRPYMYWLGFLREAREAGELDWQAIGGTWGVATSRLDHWSASEEYTNGHLSSVVKAISRAENRNAEKLARYVHKYHQDIYSHLSSLTGLLNDGARVHYIIGNSTFYGTIVSVENIYADIMRGAGFTDIAVKAIRKRNSKKELVEFEVSASWNERAGE